VDIKSENYDTMSGFIIETIGYIPENNEVNHIEYKDLVFKIKEMKEKRIEKIKLFVKQKELVS
jgi:putative hemolysin